MGQLSKPARPNRYHTKLTKGEIGSIADPQCGCEVGKYDREYGHTHLRVVDRQPGLTAYQVAQQKHRSDHPSRNAVENSVES